MLTYYLLIAYNNEEIHLFQSIMSFNNTYICLWFVFYLEVLKYLNKYTSYEKMSEIKVFHFRGRKVTSQKLTPHHKAVRCGMKKIISFDLK